jgi:hypothetical protein
MYYITSSDSLQSTCHRVGPDSNLRPVHVGQMVEKWALGQFLFGVLVLSLSVSLHQRPIIDHPRATDAK